MAHTSRKPKALFFKAANSAIRPLLRSPLHGLLSGRLLVLTYEGVKTGRTHAIPVAYYRWGPDEVWVFAARTGWMNNFRERRAARLLLRGQEVRAEATAVEDRDEVARLLTELVQHKGPRAIQDPFLGLPRNRLPTREEALAAADKARIARFHLTDGPTGRQAGT